MTKKEFTQKFMADAVKAEEKSGISRLFILAQAALESGWGSSAPGNMFFGIKAAKDAPAGKKQLLATSEVFSDDGQGYRFPQVISITKRPDGKYLYRVKDWFRKYESPADSFADHANFFFVNKRYAEALKVKDDPRSFADAVAKAGYATAVNYAETLKLVIETIEKNL
jgi:flagellar protein FlgJ